MARDSGGMLQGTLGLLILKALVVQDQHGYGIAQWLQDVSGDVLQIEEGSLYPALRRLEDKGLITSHWAITENNRRARYYSITPAGRRFLTAESAQFLKYAATVSSVLQARTRFA